MAIFTNTMTGNYNVPTCEGYGFEVCGHYDALIESLEDDLAITKAIHAFDIAELTAARESSFYGDLNVALEEKKDGLFAKLKEALHKLRAKITAFFGSIFRYLKSLTQDGTKFINSNGAVLKKVIGDSKINIKFDYITYEYDFDMLEQAAIPSKQLDEEYKDFEDMMRLITTTDIHNKDEIEEKYNYYYSEKYDSDRLTEIKDDWAREVRGLRPGDAIEKKKITIEKKDIDKYYKFLSKSTNLVDRIKKAQEYSNKSFDKTLKAIETFEKQDSEDMDFYGYAAKKAKDACTKTNSWITSMTNMGITIVKEAVASSKSICLKAITLYQKQGGKLK